MTTKNEKIKIAVQRVTEDILIVDNSIFVTNKNGLWLTHTNVHLSQRYIDAIKEFLVIEEDFRNFTSTVAVRKLLNELNIIYQIS